MNELDAVERKMVIVNRLYFRIEEIGVKEAHDLTEFGVTDLVGKSAHMIADDYPDCYDLVSMLNNDSLLKERVTYVLELLRKDMVRQNVR